MELKEQLPATLSVPFESTDAAVSAAPLAMLREAELRMLKLATAKLIGESIFAFVPIMTSSGASHRR